MGRKGQPLDFTMADFSDVEEKTRLLYELRDDWMYRDEVSPVLSSPQADLSLRQAQLGEWRNTNNPDMTGRIFVFAPDVMLSETDASASQRESFLLELGRLSEGGSVQEQAHAQKALDAMKAELQGREGKERAVSVTVGVKLRRADYNAQKRPHSEHFIITPLAWARKLYLISARNKPWGRSIIGNLISARSSPKALELEWRVNGKHFNVPARARVGVWADELRAGEFARARLFFDHIGTPVTIRGHGLRPSLRDAMCVGYDRVFKRLEWLLNDTCPIDPALRIGSFDYEEAQRREFFTVYHHSQGSNEVTPNETMNFLANSGHVRFVLPSKEKYRGSRKRRIEYVNEVRTAE